MSIRTHRVLAFLADLPQSFPSLLLLSACLLVAAWTYWPVGTQAQDASAKQIQAVPVLEVGKPIERELSSGQKHGYQITLSAAQYLHVSVEQLGADIQVSVFDPGGKKLVEVDSPNGAYGPEDFTIIAESAGAHRLEVQSLEGGAKNGKYEIRIAEIRAASANDRALLKSRRRELAGNQTHNYQLNLSNGQYLRLVVMQQGIDVELVVTNPEGKQLSKVDSPNGVRGPESLSIITETDGNYDLTVRALEKNAKPAHYEIRVVELRKATDKDRHLAEAARLLNESASLARKNKFDEAIASMERSLIIQQKEIGHEHPDVANGLSRLAMYHKDKGDYLKGLSLYKRALEIREKVYGPDHPNTAGALVNISSVYSAVGDSAKAKQGLQRALTIWERYLGPNHFNVAGTLLNLGSIYWSEGDLTQAVLALKRASEIQEKTFGSEHPEFAATLNNLGVVYKRAKEYAKSEASLLQALRIYEKAPRNSCHGLAHTLNNLGLLFRAKGNYEITERYYQRTLKVREECLSPDNIDIAFVSEGLAFISQMRGDTQQAISFLARSVEIRERNLELNLAAGSENQNMTFVNNRINDLGAALLGIRRSLVFSML